LAPSTALESEAFPTPPPTTVRCARFQAVSCMMLSDPTAALLA
jgi:hypothetical protein